MEIEKEIASNNNNISSFQNKWSPINFVPWTNKRADIKYIQKFQTLKVLQKQIS